MSISLRGRSVLTLDEFTPEEIRHLLQLAAELKVARRNGNETPRLRGKNIALCVEADSVSVLGSEVAAYDQGARIVRLTLPVSHAGQWGSIEDTAQVLGRIYDAIEYCGHAQSAVEELAAHAHVPVYNGCTDESHPIQALADFLTMQEFADKAPSEIAIAFLGNGRSPIAASLALGAAKLGMDFRIASPPIFWPASSFIDHVTLQARKNGGKFTVLEHVGAAVLGADFVYTASWLGEHEAGWAERIRLLSPFAVRANVMEATDNPHCKFMHCLPAFHDRSTKAGARIAKQFGLDCMEVTDSIFGSKASVVFDQAANRMHAIKAIFVATIGDPQTASSDAQRTLWPFDMR
ncbi:ornithine carbamoyltransferase [Sinorhizobium sp. 7-81]|uniref:ornithine carbamoyltransferase n=1 Tax=Sinorhizobium sp. 8-89 TaxID=3049089 RepID=UPI0024C323E1|nr:ornithine carbamoyltransferase [Sinorhizobium sp. 8-89]MDK1491241.1 ornithine carbamoyltransferase [Sinorhizobium sp. 8-89]